MKATLHVTFLTHVFSTVLCYGMHVCMYVTENDADYDKQAFIATYLVRYLCIAKLFKQNAFGSGYGYKYKPPKAIAVAMATFCTSEVTVLIPFLQISKALGIESHIN